MVNGCEESDPAIVRKPTNNAEQSAAESVERRAGAEGNAGRQNTRRAQNRVSVAQALNRVREVARKGKKERFIALLHHISVALLRQAFYEHKRDAAPGVDGMTWADYEVGIEPRLGDLLERVQSGACSTSTIFADRVASSKNVTPGNRRCS